jgi:hypothetical protein
VGCRLTQRAAASGGRILALTVQIATTAPAAKSTAPARSPAT